MTTLTLEDIFCLPESTIQYILGKNGYEYGNNLFFNRLILTILFLNSNNIGADTKYVMDDRFEHLYVQSDDYLNKEVEKIKRTSDSAFILPSSRSERTIRTIRRTRRPVRQEQLDTRTRFDLIRYIIDNSRDIKWCHLYAEVNRYPNPSKTILIETPINEVQYTAVFRKISLDWTLEKICSEVRFQIPTISWINTNLIEVSHFNTVQKDMLNEVLNSGFIENLPQLTTGIMSLTPLDKNITVFVSIKDLNVKKVRQQIHFTQYLTTFINPIPFLTDICDPSDSSDYTIPNVIQIYVPKGEHCIYFPDDKKTLIFPPGVTLEFYSAEIEEVYCIENGAPKVAKIKRYTTALSS